MGTEGTGEEDGKAPQPGEEKELGITSIIGLGKVRGREGLHHGKVKTARKGRIVEKGKKRGLWIGGRGGWLSGFAMLKGFADGVAR